MKWIVLLMLISLAVVFANPIPVPSLIMPREYINVNVYYHEDYITVNVVGVYPFKNVGYNKVKFYFPVPPDSSNISVYVNEVKVSWTWSNKTYKTILGDFPMIEWGLENPPKEFNVTVEYSEKILGKSEWIFLYPMATGRFQNTYSKQCIATITLNLVNFPDKPLVEVSTIPPTSFEANYSTSVKVYTNHLVFEKASRPFHGMEEDILFKITLKSSTETGGQDGLVMKQPLKVEANATQVDNKLNLKVRLTLNHPAYYIIWGNPVISGNNITINILVFEKPGYVIQVITVKEHVYQFENLEPGEYKIRILVNSVERSSVETVFGRKNSLQPSVILLVVATILTTVVVAVLYFVKKH